MRGAAPTKRYLVAATTLFGLFSRLSALAQSPARLSALHYIQPAPCRSNRNPTFGLPLPVCALSSNTAALSQPRFSSSASLSRVSRNRPPYVDLG